MKLLSKNWMPTPAPLLLIPSCFCPVTWPLLLTQRAPGPGMASRQCTAVLSGTCPWAILASGTRESLGSAQPFGPVLAESLGQQAGRGLALR